MLLKIFLIFLLGFVFAFFCGKNQCVAPICTGSFWFICVFFLRLHAITLLVCWYHNPVQALTARIYPYYTLWSIFRKPKVSLIFLQCTCVAKYCHTPAFSNIFLLFRVPLVSTSPTAPICIDIYPSAPIRVSFCISAQNIMSGEISPAIRPKSMHFVPIYVHDCLVFLLAHTPAPYCTHLHPFAPICTHQNPKLYCIFVLYMLI